MDVGEVRFEPSIGYSRDAVLVEADLSGPRFIKWGSRSS
jgi:hypothetical protein